MSKLSRKSRKATGKKFRKQARNLLEKNPQLRKKSKKVLGMTDKELVDYLSRHTLTELREKVEGYERAKKLGFLEIEKDLVRPKKGREVRKFLGKRGKRSKTTTQEVADAVGAGNQEISGVITQLAARGFKPALRIKKQTYMGRKSVLIEKMRLKGRYKEVREFRKEISEASSQKERIKVVKKFERKI